MHLLGRPGALRSCVVTATALSGLAVRLFLASATAASAFAPNSVATAPSSAKRASCSSPLSIAMSPPKDPTTEAFRRGTAAFSAATDAAVATAPDTPSSASSEKTNNNSDDAVVPSFADYVKQNSQNSWIRQLSPETPENYRKSKVVAALPENYDDNQRKRPVKNGHYVLVRPTPLPNPRLVLYSSDVAHQVLGFSESHVQSPEFLAWVSGAIDPALGLNESWATPYALSIMGTRYTSNCPYGTGDGYGDGRAISIGELRNAEVQLKGAGPTPFHRGADGRAVLRSSIREFLASEAMHRLGVPTTRALSLVVSESETVQRPWYSDGVRTNLPSLDDPRLQKYSIEDRKRILAQLRQQKEDPNVLVAEPAAITTRVATSFVRVGHLDLFARRAEKASVAASEQTQSRWNTQSPEWHELEQMAWHACYREYRNSAYDPFREKNDLASAAEVFLRESAAKLAQMVAHWIRVGFSQGNFNADNCLVGGNTMDYGPFGFMDEYNPLFAKWTGSGDHFGFLNQPSAGFANYQVLVESVVPLICAARNLEDPTETIKEFLAPAAKLFQSAVDETLRTKLGFLPDHDAGDEVWEALEPLLRTSRVDWTLFFRQLTYVARDSFSSALPDGREMLQNLEGGGDPTRNPRNPFYEHLDEETRHKFEQWFRVWSEALLQTGSAEAAFERMRRINPKFVLREWMLVEAYKGAAKGDEAELFSLYQLIQHPYDEGSPNDVERYYRRAPDEALATGGTAFMSCSS